MEIKEFAEEIRNKISQTMGAGYEISLHEVQKNNGVWLMGLVILEKGNNVSPTIYLNHFWEAHLGGVSFEEITARILRIYHEDGVRKSIDMSFFRDFEQVKGRICYRLIHAGKNKNLLEQIPYVPFLDLAVCFYYAMQDKVLGNGSILIYNTHMEHWKTTTAQLMMLAQNNTPRLLPPECISMEALLEELMREQQGCPQIVFDSEIPMKVISNPDRMYGAACMLYPGVMEKFAEKFGSDFYIIPSSIHELIVLPGESVEQPGELKAMIGEVNRFQVEPEEVLSDNLYFYSRKDRNVKIV